MKIIGTTVGHMKEIFLAMENITFTKKETEKLQELYKNKEVFPMFTTTEFTTESGFQVWLQR